MEFNVVIGGEAGQGAYTVELTLTDLLSRLGYHFFATKNYMSRIRGGHNFHMVRIADHAVHALAGGHWDMVVALDRETEKRHRPHLNENGIYLSLPMIAEISKETLEEFHDVTVINTVLVGVILSVINADPEKSATVAGPGSAEYVMKGFEYAARWKMGNASPMSPQAGEHCVFDGNKAVALGAFLGGCQFMAGYPMTPATSIMHYFATAAVSLPAHFEQAEDEISAINMALGASYAGVRSMVATSGGGFALMQEAVSLAGMTETPIVICVGQRPGPATGLPTRTEQGDLNLVLHAGHGEFPRIIFAPGSIGEAIDLTRKSFDLADRYQVPVFILTDQYFADSVQLLEESVPTLATGRTYDDFDTPYQRYALTESGISPLTFPGLSAALVRVDSDEHDESGFITEDPALRVRMVDKRLGKTRLMQKDAVPPTFYGDAAAEAVVLSWGSNRLIVEEAVDKLAREHMGVASLHFGQVYPLWDDMIAPYRLGGKTLVCVENNARGQFASLLKREFDLRVDYQIFQYNGECFRVEELSDRLKHLLAREVKAS